VLLDTVEQHVVRDESWKQAGAAGRRA